MQYVWSETVCVASSLPTCRGRGGGSSDTPSAETGGGDGGFSEVLSTSPENDRRGGTRWTFSPALVNGVFFRKSKRGMRWTLRQISQADFGGRRRKFRERIWCIIQRHFATLGIDGIADALGILPWRIFVFVLFERGRRGVLHSADRSTFRPMSTH